MTALVFCNCRLAGHGSAAWPRDKNGNKDILTKFYDKNRQKGARGENSGKGKGRKRGPADIFFPRDGVFFPYIFERQNFQPDRGCFPMDYKIFIQLAPLIFCPLICILKRRLTFQEFADPGCPKGSIRFKMQTIRNASFPDKRAEIFNVYQILRICAVTKPRNFSGACYSAEKDPSRRGEIRPTGFGFRRQRHLMGIKIPGPLS